MNFKKDRFYLILLSLFLAPNTVFASSFECKSPQTVDDKFLLEIDRKYYEVADFSAKFEQISIAVGLNEKSTSQGEVLFKRPGKMNWLYSTPEIQRFVGDGEKLWHYLPKENQATISPFENSFKSDLPVSFLLGIGKLNETFKTSGGCKAAKGTLIKLQPKNKDKTLSELQLLIDDKTKFPIGARIVDLGGNITEIVFTSPDLNSGIKDSAFKFDIPKGVDIIDLRKK